LFYASGDGFRQSLSPFFVITPGNFQQLANFADVNVLELLDGIDIDQLPEWAREPESNNKRFAIALSFPGGLFDFEQEDS
jgi:hypothetical protein